MSEIRWSTEHDCWELCIDGPGEPVARSTSYELLRQFNEYIDTRPRDSSSRAATGGWRPNKPR